MNRLENAGIGFFDRQPLRKLMVIGGPLRHFAHRAEWSRPPAEQSRQTILSQRQSQAYSQSWSWWAPCREWVTFDITILP
jgi:hypothetical protein